MLNQKSWLKVVGCVAGALCMTQAWAVSLTSEEECWDLGVSNGSQSEATLLAAVKALGYGDAEAVFKAPTSGLTVNGLNTTSGDWSYVSPDNTVLGYILKGGNNAIFCPTSDEGGTWSTDHPFLLVGGGPEGARNPPGLSYFAIVTTTKSVPEPASVLAGLLALGIGAFGYRRMQRVS
jgi:hypothetical protein